MLRRLRLGQSARAIAKELGPSRNTVKDYAGRFERAGLLAGDPIALPTATELEQLLGLHVRAEPTPPRLLPFREEIRELVSAPLQVKVAWERFREAHADIHPSYTAFRRFVRRYVSGDRPRAVMRIEVGPGEEAQVDFGFVGNIPLKPGAEPRETWAFVLTLSHSRHQYVELVQDQTVPTWLALHRRAFEFLGGVPRKILLDNLKAGIIKASVTDPEAQRAYRECAEAYGFMISPCVARTPEHKGKVERGVQYFRRSFIAGRTFKSIDEANRLALEWVMMTAGERVHGTTHEVPLVVFSERERPALLPLPAVPFEIVEWKQVKLHPDCHVVFGKAYYSAPHVLIGKSLWLRASGFVVQVFHDHRLVATHGRASRPGQRVQNPAHFPPEKLRYFMQHPTWCRQQAAKVGPNTATFVERLLSDKVVDKLRGAQATLRLAEKYSPERLEAACRRALACEAIAFNTLKTMLLRGLDQQPLPGELVPAEPQQRPLFARSFDDLFNPADSATTTKGSTWISFIN
jgi:transposase